MRRNNALTLFCFIFALVFLYTPLLYLIFQAFLNDPNHLDSGLTLKWIQKLFQSESLWQPLWNSLEIGFLSAAISVTLGTFGAVGLTPVASVLPVSLQSLIMLPILLPEVITGL